MLVHGTIPKSEQKLWKIWRIGMGQAVSQCQPIKSHRKPPPQLDQHLKGLDSLSMVVVTLARVQRQLRLQGLLKGCRWPGALRQRPSQGGVSLLQFLLLRSAHLLLQQIPSMHRLMQTHRRWVAAKLAGSMWYKLACMSVCKQVVWCLSIKLAVMTGAIAVEHCTIVVGYAEAVISDMHQLQLRSCSG